MPGTKISAYTAHTALAGNDLFAVVDSTANATKKITASIAGKDLTKLGLSVGTTAPTSPYNGQPWIDTTTNPPLVKVWNGATWTVIGALDSPAFTGTPTAPTAVADTNTTQIATTAFVIGQNYLKASTAASTYLPLSGGTLSGPLTLPANPTTNLQAATKQYVDSLLAGIVTVPTGTVIWTARNSAPTGYLKANGAAISRSTYADLFAAIGTTYGVGDGSTTFNLPDLRGEFVRGWDDGRGVDTGRAIGTTQSDELKSHTHTINDPGHSHSTAAGGGGGSIIAGFQGNGVGPYYTNSATTGITINATGGTETRPRNIALLACIKF